MIRSSFQSLCLMAILAAAAIYGRTGPIEVVPQPTGLSPAAAPTDLSALLNMIRPACVSVPTSCFTQPAQARLYANAMSAPVAGNPPPRAPLPTAVPADAGTFVQRISNGPETLETQFVGGHAMPGQGPVLPPPGEATYVASQLVPATYGTNWQNRRLDVAWRIYSRQLGY